MDGAIEQLSVAFQCPFCYELNSSRSKPRVLPCGHGNVCDSDLRALWQEARQSGSPFKCLQGCSLPNCPPIDKLPYNWAMISAGDALEDLLAARDSSHSILSGAAKRAAQLIDAIATDSSSVPVADVIHNAHAIYRSLTQSYRSDPKI